MENDDILNDDITSAAGAGFTTQAAMVGDAPTTETSDVLLGTPQVIVDDDDLDFFPADNQALVDLMVARINDVLGSDAINFDEDVDPAVLAQLVEFANTPVADLAATTGLAPADAPAPAQDEQVQAIDTVDIAEEQQNAPEQDEGPVQTIADAPESAPEDIVDDGANALPTDVGDVAAQTGEAVTDDAAAAPATDDMLDCPPGMMGMNMTGMMGMEPVIIDDSGLPLPDDQALTTDGEGIAQEPVIIDDSELPLPEDPTLTNNDANDTVALEPDVNVMDMINDMADMMAVPDADLGGDMDDCV